MGLVNLLLKSSGSTGRNCMQAACDSQPVHSCPASPELVLAYALLPPLAPLPVCTEIATGELPVRGQMRDPQ